MLKAFFAVLMAGLLSSTLPFEAEDATDCDGCASHGSSDPCCPKDGSHSHGDKDDRHDGPESPCSHEKDFHCCCGHVQAMIGASPSDLIAPVAGEQITVTSQAVKVDPTPSRTFHIPIA
jgi:hypothetical protein